MAFSKRKLIFKIARNAYETFFSAELTLLATNLAFYTIFALVPVFALFLFVSNLAGNFIVVTEELGVEIFQYLLAGSGSELFREYSSVISQVEPAGMGIIGIAGLLFTSVKMVFNLDTSILRIWKEERDRKWWQRILIYTGIIVFAPVILAIAAGVLDWEVLNRIIPVFLRSTTVIIFLCLYLCFKYTPPKKISKSAALSGAIFTFILLYLGKEIYTWVTTHLFSYDRIYGSLAFLPLFLLWLFIIWSLILTGFTITKAIDEAREELIP